MNPRPLRMAQAIFVAQMVLLLAASLGGAQPTAPEVAVAQIEVIGRAPHWINGTVEDSRIRVTVRNNGAATTGYTLRYYWGAVGETHFLNGDAARSSDVGRDPLPSGGTRAHEADWTVQPGQRGQGAIIAVVEMAGDTNAANDVQSLSYQVPVHAFTITESPADLSIRLDETRFFRVQVVNGGTGIETLALTVQATGDTQRFAAWVEPELLTVAAGQQATATLWVTHPFDGTTAPADATLRVTAHDPQVAGVWKQTGPMSIHSLDAPYDGEYGFDLRSVPGNPYFVAPGQATPVRFDLVNTGNRDDSYAFRASGTAGWTVATTMTRVGLRPGETTAVVLQVTGPQGLPAGSPATITLRVEPEHAPPVTKDVEMRLHGPLVRVMSVDPAPRIYADQSSPVSIVLANLGSRPSMGGTLAMSSIPSAPGTSQLIPIPALTATEQLTVHANATWAGLAGSVMYHVAWQPAEPSDPTHATGTALFVRTVGLGIDAPAGLAGIPGQHVGYGNSPYVFRVHNFGNVAQVVRLQAQSDTDTAAVSGPAELVLEPGEARAVPIVHALPSPWPEGPTMVGLAAALAERRDVTAVAQTATSVRDGVPPTVRFIDLPSKWASGARLPVAIALADDTRVANVSLIVSRDGSRYEALSMAEPPETWLVNSTLANGTYTLEAEAVDGAGRRGVAHATVEVRPFAPPRIVDHSPDHGAKVAAHAAVMAIVVDNLAVNATLQVDGGPIVELQVEAGANGTAVLRGFLDASPGEHSLTLHVVNEAGRTNETVWLVTVMAATGGTVPRDDTGQDTPGPGVPLVLVLLALTRLVRARNGPSERA